MRTESLQRIPGVRAKLIACERAARDNAMDAARRLKAGGYDARWVRDVVTSARRASQALVRHLQRS